MSGVAPVVRGTEVGQLRLWPLLVPRSLLLAPLATQLAQPVVEGPVEIAAVTVFAATVAAVLTAAAAATG